MLCATDQAETAQAESPAALFHVSRDLHLTLVLVKACSTTTALAEPAMETLPEVTVCESTNTIDIIRVQHHELKEKQASKVPTSRGLADQIRSGEVFLAG